MSTKVETIEVGTLRDWLEQGQPVFVLDIRDEEDCAEWRIPNSLNVPVYDRLKAGDPNALSGVEFPEGKPIVTVCFQGNTSKIAASQLRARGLQAFSLNGGMQAWSLAWNTAEVSLLDSDARVIQVRRTGKGCLSYLIGSDGEAAVIDPSVETEVYVQLAQQQGWSITKVLDTHVHADHLSRAHQIVNHVGAELYLLDNQRVSFPFQALHDGDTVEVGKTKIKTLHTPGHTWESACYLLDDQALFSGDTLFLDSVGRPDLKASSEETRKRAYALYQSLQRLLTLPGETLILPCHTSEPIPFDGKPLYANLSQVRAQVELLSLPEDEFVNTIVRRIPPNPPNHLQIVGLNETGQFPAGDPTELEAGANRCAIA